MIVINTVDAQKFTYNSIPYFKNFTPVVIGNKLEIVNTYSNQGLKLTDAPTIFSDFIVDGVTYASPALLQQALLPVLFTRDTLGAASNLNGLTDVDITTPTDGQAILYNSVSGNWENADVSGGGLVTGLKVSETSAASAVYKAQWATRNLSFSTDNHTRDAWLANATGSQRIVIRFGRSVTIKKIGILNYFNNTSSENIVTGTGNAGVNNFTMLRLTGDDSLVTTTYNADLTELTSFYTGVIPRVFDSKEIFFPTITEQTTETLVFDCVDNHGSPSNIGIRKIWIYE